jgi:hypothetical protein
VSGGGNQTEDVVGRSFDRLAARMLKYGYRLRSVSRNLRRCSRYNDEEAWEGEVERLEDGAYLSVFSWSSVTELLRSKELSITEEEGEYWGGGRRSPRSRLSVDPA